MKRSFQTTVGVSEDDKRAINELAQKLDLPQRRVVSLLLETYHKAQVAATAHNPPNELVSNIRLTREQILKRIDALIAILRDQEKNLLKPTLITSQNNYSFQKAGVNEILTTITQLIHLYHERQ